MQANLNWLTDPELFRVNRLDAHSDHICYASKEECKGVMRYAGKPQLADGSGIVSGQPSGCPLGSYLLRIQRGVGSGLCRQTSTG